MRYFQRLPVATILLTSGFLSACNTTTPAAVTATPAMTVATSGMTPSTSAFDRFKTGFDAAYVQRETTTPVSGSADYNGQVEVHTTASTTDPDNVVFGDVAMNVNFGGGANPISATVSNIEGRIAATDTKISGTLTHKVGSGINQIIVLPVAGTTRTNIGVQVEGALADPTGTLTGNARMVITGTAFGADAASFTGANSVAITDSTGANKKNAGGRFYADK